MKIEYWNHSEVNEDGTIGSPPNANMGCIDIDPKMDTGGLHHLQTITAKATPWFLLVSTGRLADGMMHGIALTFDDEAEMRAFSRKRVGEGFVNAD